ncbi:MAG: helix-turn-helix domain-containing protein [Acetobacter syzygii]|uniref:winged helix-turn-helix transcriptional regulator n=1 Tax=Acetobacter syzygii TaxID=146476 RepID=UPI0039EA6828
MIDKEKQKKLYKSLGMKSFREGDFAIEVMDKVSDKWMLLISEMIFLRSPIRYMEISRSIPSISLRMLTLRLKQMEEIGLIYKENIEGGGAQMQYYLTELGVSYREAFSQAWIWAKNIKQ